MEWTLDYCEEHRGRIEKLISQGTATSKRRRKTFRVTDPRILGLDDK